MHAGHKKSTHAVSVITFKRTHLCLLEIHSVKHGLDTSTWNLSVFPSEVAEFAAASELWWGRWLPSIMKYSILKIVKTNQEALSASELRYFECKMQMS